MDYICHVVCAFRQPNGFCGKTSGYENCQYRQLHQPNTVVGYVPIKPQTNADRIRAMSDDELASAIRNPCDFSTHIPSEWCRNRRCGFICTLEWLRQECEDD